PYFAPRSYWSIESSLAEAGFDSVPYHVSVPSFGDWGFHLAAVGAAPELRLPDNAGDLRSLDAEALRAAGVFPADRRRMPNVPPSTLMHPRILEYAMEEWQDY
ncbi:MAG: polyamine aminopropyltransferase, partial [Haloechinothrix sp.]